MVRITGSRYYRGEYRVVSVRQGGCAGAASWSARVEVDIGREDGKMLVAERWENV
jgi:hypothetical protein